MEKVIQIRKLSSIVLIVLVALLMSQKSYAEKKGETNDGKTVTLVTSGTGTTKEEATKNALRSAIEQAFGTFVSANTTVVNDDNVKDEIVTITSGNIKSYDEINSRQVSGQDGNMFEVTVHAVVSIDNLVRFAQNHGMSAELAGQTFAMNIKIAQLNRFNENAALRHLIIQLYEIAKLGLYDFSIKVSEPVMEDGAAVVEVSVIPTPNANYRAYVELAKKTISSLSMSSTEYNNALSSGMGAYVCGWKDKSIIEGTGLVSNTDFFVQGKGEFRLRNNVNEFNESTNEWFEITNGANFIYYYERFKYLSKFAFGLQDNIGHQVETIENLDRLEYVNIGGVKRMRSLGKQEEYRHGYYEEKFEAKVIKGQFADFRSSYNLYAGIDESSAYFKLGYSMSQISNLSKIDVYPRPVNLIDNQIIMEALKGTATLKDMYEEANKYVSLANEARHEKKLRYLNMADDLYGMIMIFLPKDVDKSDIQNMRNKIKTIVNDIL